MLPSGREERHTYKHLCCGVVHIEGLKDSCAIIRHHYLMASAHALQDFVLQLHIAANMIQGAISCCEQDGIAHSAGQTDFIARPMTRETLTMPLGPSVVFTRSAIAIAPMNAACRGTAFPLGHRWGT